MADPNEYNDEKDKRLDSVSGSPRLPGQSAASGNISGVVDSGYRLPSNVGVVSSASSAAGEAAVLVAASWELDALDSFRDDTEGYCRITSADAGGMEMMARSTMPWVVPGAGE